MNVKRTLFFFAAAAVAFFFDDGFCVCAEWVSELKNLRASEWWIDN